MATERLYYRDSYLREFTARVLGSRPSGDRFEIRLDRTAFYPEGGGQPPDRGWLGDVAVLEVVERDGEVLHLAGADVKPGEMQGQIDWARRFDHMQQHSGQHILSEAFIQAVGAPTVSFHMGPDASTIDIAIPAPTVEQVKKAEEIANAVIFEDRPIVVHMVTAGELTSFDLRKTTERTGEIRVVEVESFDSIPCGGTHCRRAGEIGLIKATRWERRGANTRVEFLCGWRALRDYDEKNSALLSLAANLSVRTGEVPEAFERLSRELAEVRHHAGQLRNRLLDYRAEELARQAMPVGQARVVAALVEDASPEDLKHLAGRLTSESGRVALLACSSDRAHLVFARSADLTLDAGELLRRALGPRGGRGGGRPNLAQGGLPEPSSAQAALDDAVSLLRDRG